MTNEEILRAAAQKWFRDHPEDIELRVALGGPPRATGEHLNESIGGGYAWCETCDSQCGGLGGWYPHQVCTYVAPEDSSSPKAP